VLVKELLQASEHHFLKNDACLAMLNYLETKRIPLKAETIAPMFYLLAAMGNYNAFLSVLHRALSFVSSLIPLSSAFFFEQF